MSQFNVGDLVTGIDRSLIRSIYQLIENIDDRQGIYRSYAYNGHDMRSDASRGFTGPRKHAEFRLATKSDISRSLNMKPTRYLVTTLYQLGISSAEDLLWKMRQ